MIQSSEIQKLYIDLYKELKEFIWPIRVVERIADLEVACFDKFPSVSAIQNCLRRLKLDTYIDMKSSDEFKPVLDKFDKFEKFLDDNKNEKLYSKVVVLKEVNS